MTIKDYILTNMLIQLVSNVDKKTYRTVCLKTAVCPFTSEGMPVSYGSCS